MPRGPRVSAIAGPALIAAWGVLMIVWALRLTHAARLQRRALWAAAFTDIMGWLVVCALTLFDYWQQDLPRLLNPGNFWPFFASTCALQGRTLPVTAVLLWYWWPVLRGRESGDLRPAVPTCAKCGYCLVGNVSGRCPECGQPSGGSGLTATRG